LDLLGVCRLCGAVHGEVFRHAPNADGHGMRQACDCVTTPPMETWPGYDFNQAVTLCRCCGRKLLMSGLRWSEWFCDGCLPPIETINRVCSNCVIPTGRHSLLEHLAWSNEGPYAEVPEFIRELGDWFDRVERLETHARNVVHDNLALLSEGTTETDVPLTEYLQRLPSTTASVQAAVLALGRAFKVPEHLLMHCG
jgi:hypothetical protein